MTDTETRTRIAYVRNLFDLATLLDNNSELPLPWSLGCSGLTWYVHDDIETVLAIRDLMADPVTAPYDSVQGNFPVEVTGTLAGFAVSVLVAKEIALAPGEGFIVQRPAMNPRLLAEQVPA
jgi:hypothetical protein